MNSATRSITDKSGTETATDTTPEAAAISAVQLVNAHVKLKWQKQPDGWHLVEASAKADGDWLPLPAPSGLHTILFLARKAAVALVEVDREGNAHAFYPSDAEQRDANTIVFRHLLPIGQVESVWSLDPEFATDVRVRLNISAAKRGSYSIASPTLCVFEPDQIGWGMVPGNWYGTDVQSNFELSPMYSQGIPNRAYLARERNSMTLCPLLSTKTGLTLGVIPDPGTAADPWENDVLTRDAWKLGLSTMDRYAQLTPVIYHPVLGQAGSTVDPGATISLGFRYTIAAAPWFSVYRHAVMNIYRFSDLLSLQTSRESLSFRVGKLAQLLANDVKSSWKVVQIQGVEIGSNGTKTSDVAAMYMLAKLTGDDKIQARLPYIRRYKLAQQQMAPGFFQHAATGEYPGESAFEAERGNWIEPLFTTYYTMLDMGNMSLFDPADIELKHRIRLAAEKLLHWQHADGSFDVAYDSVSHRSSFPQLEDLRPTWYGLCVAARVLKEDRYLNVARKGADWYLTNAVEKGHYLGACGDALNIWDFTTVFGAQALLDLYELTQESKYKDAAIEVARVYATSVFTQPIPTTTQKMLGEVTRQDWEITQVGLSVEHIRGTAQSGPVLLSSHAGLFIRIYELTGDTIFRDMARASARGRHHFADPETGMAVYYWNAIDNVSAVWNIFPWHAEWQVGWITDYLVSEAHLRSNGQIHFPAGFPTPKVGSHVTYGFAPGSIYGIDAELWSGRSAVSIDNPNVEYLSAISVDRHTLFVVLLNQFVESQECTVAIDRGQRAFGKSLDWAKCTAFAGEIAESRSSNGRLKVKFAAWGIGVIAFELPND